MNVWKSIKVYQLFFLWATHFGKLREHNKDRVKLLQSNVLNSCLKITKADLQA